MSIIFRIPSNPPLLFHQVGIIFKGSTFTNSNYSNVFLKYVAFVCILEFVPHTSSLDVEKFMVYPIINFSFLTYWRSKKVS
jgi:hypothetical protein